MDEYTHSFMMTSTTHDTLLLTARNLVVGYERALHKPISFSIKPRHITLLYGENGAGKSSIIQALAGLATIWNGTLIAHPDTIVALHPQHPPRLDEIPLTASEYAYILAVKPPLPAALKPLHNKLLHQLSYGQMQLLSIWCTLNSTANLIILDEPTNHLDHAACALICAWLRALPSHQGVLLISHDPLLTSLAHHRIMIERL